MSAFLLVAYTIGWPICAGIVVWLACVSTLEPEPAPYVRDNTAHNRRMQKIDDDHARAMAEYPAYREDRQRDEKRAADAKIMRPAVFHIVYPGHKHPLARWEK